MFEHCRNIADLKAEYRTLARTYHPDTGGDAELFALMQEEYAYKVREFEAANSLKHAIGAGMIFLTKFIALLPDDNDDEPDELTAKTPPTTPQPQQPAIIQGILIR